MKEKFDYLKMNEAERRRFEAHVDHTRSEWGTITHAREEGIEEGIQMGREEGIKEGLQLGKEKGIEEGIKQGIEQGARKRSLEIARAPEREGLPPARIAEIAGISLSELEDL